MDGPGIDGEGGRGGRGGLWGGARGNGRGGDCEGKKEKKFNANL